MPRAAEGCRISGYHEWSKEDRSGRETLAGVADAASGELILQELGPHPEGATTGRIWAQLKGDGQMRLAYLAVRSTSGADFGRAFATRLAPEGSDGPAEPLVCEERVGSWRGEDTSFHRIPADDEWFLQQADVADAEIEVHEGCGFQGIMGWRYADREGEEVVVGVMTGEDEAIMQEVGAHPLGDVGSQGPKYVRHLSADELDVYQVALTGDAAEAHADAARWHAEGETRDAAACPDMTGIWRSGPYIATRVREDGSREDVDIEGRELAVAAQEGCVLRGTNRWRAAGAEDWHEEPVAGVMDPDGGRLFLAEFPPHPVPGTTALIEERVVDADTLSTLYVGSSGDGSFLGAVRTTLTRAADAP